MPTPLSRHLTPSQSHFLWLRGPRWQCCLLPLVHMNWTYWTMQCRYWRRLRQSSRRHIQSPHPLCPLSSQLLSQVVWLNSLLCLPLILPLFLLYHSSLFIFLSGILNGTINLADSPSDYFMVSVTFRHSSGLLSSSGHFWAGLLDRVLLAKVQGNLVNIKPCII